MQIKETIGVYFSGSVERSPLEDVVVLVDGAGLGDAGYRTAAVEKMYEAVARGATLVHLSLPRVHAAGLHSCIVGTEITYTLTPNGGVFHVINPATAAPTS